MDVDYLRYQDDIIILCKTKRQLNRCYRRMQNILQERSLRLSRKKTRVGAIAQGFHFLGIDYPATQPQDNISVTQVSNEITSDVKPVQFLNKTGG